MIRTIQVLPFILFCFCGVLSAQFERMAPQFSPNFDGVLSNIETKSQLMVPTIWPMFDGSLIFEGSGFEEVDISATWYISWDEKNLNVSADVWDDTPIYRNSSPGPYNGQDAIQPVFNPFNDPDHLFIDNIAPEDPVEDEVAAIYDIVFDTRDGIGPHIFRHGHLLSDEQQQSITVTGSKTELGYVLEAAIPWSVAMDDVAPDYVPSLGDEHGLSFILISFNAQDGPLADIATLMTDFGEGDNTISDPTSWNSIRLVRPITIRGDLNADGVRDIKDIDILWTAIQEKSDDLFFDLDGSNSVNSLDYGFWVRSLRNTWFGDANLDSEFNSTDLVRVFQFGEYEDEVVGNSTWSEGDFDGDGDFASSDFVTAFQDGGYERGSREDVQVVPEPRFPTVVAILLGFWLIHRLPSLRCYTNSSAR